MSDDKLPKKANQDNKPVKQDALEKIGNGILSELRNKDHAKYYRAILSAALGSIPWVGGVYAALISLQAESDQEEVNNLQKMWLMEHKEKIINLGQTLKDITKRLDDFCTNTEAEKIVLNRIQSPEYLTLVRETFRAWDEASTFDKRDKFKKLITNAAAIELCTDDMIRIFIKWIAEYHEYHISIISVVYKNPGISLGSIWDQVFGKEGEGRPRENSAEADLYRTLIRDLQLGGVIRQQRDVNYAGQFVKKSTKGKSSASSSVLKSSFDDDDEMELSELGGQFVRYVLEELVPRIGDGTENPSNAI